MPTLSRRGFFGIIHAAPAAAVGIGAAPPVKAEESGHWTITYNRSEMRAIARQEASLLMWPRAVERNGDWRT